MAPYDPPGRQTGQPPQSSTGQPPQGGQPTGQTSTGGAPPGGEYQGTVQQAPPVAEMEVSTPTLRWISIGHPQEQLPLGEDDYVLDSFYNAQLDAWEVLVLVQPRETEAEDEDDE